MSNNCFLLCTHGSDAFFAGGLLVALTSLRRTNPRIPVVVFANDLSAFQREQLRGCIVIDVEKEVFDVRHRPDLTEATCFKFYAERLTGFDRVLCLDSDIVVLGDLTPIFSIPGPLVARLRERSLAREFSQRDAVSAGEGIPEGYPMLNGGVVCLDRRFWAQRGMLREALEIANRYEWKNFRNVDQGILNILAHRVGGCAPLSAEFNYCRWHDMIQNPAYPIVEAGGIFAPAGPSGNVRLLHWNGPTKPWEANFVQQGQDALDRMYLRCYAQFVDPSGLRE